jgi:hypothetical protein
MNITFENAKKYIGKKVRIVKICAPFFKENCLGKIDYIERVDECIFLKNAKMNVNPSWIELVNDDATDIEMEINENTIFNPFGTLC